MIASQALLDVGFANDRTTGKEDWLTPPWLLKALGSPDAFDLDPCSPMVRPWETARKHYSLVDNGLNQSWSGRIWLNPPYGNQAAKWMERLAQHGDGIALIFARTETATFFPWVWDYATGVLFIRGRLSFYTKEGRPGGVAGAPSMLIAYGEECFSMIENAPLDGKRVRTLPGIGHSLSPQSSVLCPQPV